jgi:hypothetical protein
MAIPKRRPDLVFAINGQMAGLAMLGAQACASFYFLQERIFCSYGLAPKPPTQPSGFVPGCGWGGAALPLLNAGGIQGPDCVSAIFFGVCSVEVKDLVVISCFLWSSLYFCIHRWNEFSRSFGTFPVQKKLSLCVVIYESDDYRDRLLIPARDDD